MLAIAGFFIILLMCYVFKLASKRGKIEAVAAGFFLLLALWGFAPPILIEFYARRAVGTTKGVRTISSKPRRNVIDFEYRIKDQVYSRSALFPAGIDSLVVYEGQYYVLYSPLMPFAGYIDFEQPVRK